MFRGFYINLDKSHDRLDHFNKNILSLPEFQLIKRAVAFEHVSGGLGCTISHIAVLQALQQISTIENLKYVIVLEDDFCILDGKMNNYIQFIESFKLIADLPTWDVITLTPRIMDTITVPDSVDMFKHGFKRINHSLACTGYIVKSSYIPTLLNAFINSYHYIMAGYPVSCVAIDVMWLHLQCNNNFYCFSHIFGGQLPSWSNIEKKYVDYTSVFLESEHKVIHPNYHNVESKSTLTHN